MVWYPINPDCVSTGLRNDVPYEDLACLYPNALGKTYFEFERTVPQPVYNLWEWMESNPWCPIAACVVYAIGIVAGQRFFASRPAWNLRTPLAAWNLFLAVFSFAGFLRMAPLLVHNFTHYSLRDNLCENPYSIIGSGTHGMWVLVFVLSKFIELIDTFFIVVHKKPLMFLHWYHHITVLLACWHAWITETPAGYIFCTMNYGVHSVMYFYYFLMAVKCKPKWFSPLAITAVQILQMVVGVFVAVQAYTLIRKENHDGVKRCFASLENVQFFFFIYATYLLLFGKFFVQRYIFKNTTKKNNKTKKLA